MELINDYMAQVKDSFASNYVREVFSEILNSIEFGLKLDLKVEEIESELDQKEGELRLWASQDNQTLNDEVTSLRKQVEYSR